MNETARILCAISSTERTYAAEFIAALGDDRPPWTELFKTLNALESQELISTLRDGHNGIIWAKLTPLGAERTREAQ